MARGRVAARTSSCTRRGEFAARSPPSAPAVPRPASRSWPSARALRRRARRAERSTRCAPSTASRPTRTASASSTGTASRSPRRRSTDGRRERRTSARRSPRCAPLPGHVARRRAPARLPHPRLGRAARDRLVPARLPRGDRPARRSSTCACCSATGRRRPGALGPLPAGVHAERWVAAGRGRCRTSRRWSATAAPAASRTALACGVPMAVLPLFGDQPLNARGGRRAPAPGSRSTAAGSIAAARRAAAARPALRRAARPDRAPRSRRCRSRARRCDRRCSPRYLA